MAKKRFIIFLFFGFTLLLQNCQNCDSAGSANTSSIRVGFYTLDTDNNLVADTTIFEQITAAESNSIFYDSEDTTNIFSLELPLAKDTVSFFFQNTTDTYELKIGFDRQIAVKQPDCGLEDRILNLRLVSHSFDSLRLENTGLTLSDTLVNFIVIQ